MLRVNDCRPVLWRVSYERFYVASSFWKPYWDVVPQSFDVLPYSGLYTPEYVHLPQWWPRAGGGRATSLTIDRAPHSRSRRVPQGAGAVGCYREDRGGGRHERAAA